jgi:hypothetical protein
MAKKWGYRRVEIDCCRLNGCMQDVFKDDLCRFHYSQREMLPKRIEISAGEREWYAEQGRTFDEAAFLARRYPAAS